MSEAFAHTLKRNTIQVTPLPDAASALTLIGTWFPDYSDHHPHSKLKMLLASRVHRNPNRNRLSIQSIGGRISDPQPIFMGDDVPCADARWSAQ